MSALWFDAKTLATNREGYLTKRQQFGLYWNLILRVMMGTGAFLILIGGPVCSTINRTSGLEGATLFAVFVALASLLIGSVLVYRQNQSLPARCVLSYTGRVKKQSTGRHWEIVLVNEPDVAERTFKVGYFAYHAFIEGKPYTIYWLPFALSPILSAEYGPEDML